jgi:hypothetical protein
MSRRIELAGHLTSALYTGNTVVQKAVPTA